MLAILWDMRGFTIRGLTGLDGLIVSETQNGCLCLHFQETYVNVFAMSFDKLYFNQVPSHLLFIIII